MKKCLLLSLLMVICHQSYAQTDTVYFDKYRKQVDKRQDGSYYRIIRPQDSVFNVTEYYLNGKIKMSGSLSSVKPEVFNGMATWYSEDGVATTKGFYKNNKREDHLIRYYPDGSIESDAVYKAGSLHGAYQFYYPNKILKRVDIYQEGNFVSGTCYAPTGAEMPYYSYLQYPEFTGGVEKLAKYMAANLVYPKTAIRQEITGTVRVKFTVTSDGNIIDVHLENTIHPLIDNEALRLVKNMPKWKAGLEDNKKAEFTMILPVEFRLEG